MKIAFDPLNKNENTLSKPVYSHMLNTHNKQWINNYYKDPSVSKRDNLCVTPDLSISDKKATEYRLWIEAGKVNATSLPQNVDVSYNFNMWRNFKKCFLDDDTVEIENDKIIDQVAKIYPVTIPKPSKLQDNNIIKYTESAKLISNPVKRKVIIENLKLDKKYMDQWKLKTQMRNPPLNEKGNINPPQGYKKYDHYFFPQARTPSMGEEENGDLLDPDVFGRLQRIHFKPSIWKLCKKSKNSAFKEAMEYGHYLVPFHK